MAEVGDLLLGGLCQLVGAAADNLSRSKEGTGRTSKGDSVGG